MQEQISSASSALPVALPARSPRPPVEESRIADLSPGQISRLDSDQLVDIIRAVRLPVLRQDALESMPGYDRATLERLVFLTQRCCRHRRGDRVL